MASSSSPHPTAERPLAITANAGTQRPRMTQAHTASQRDNLDFVIPAQAGIHFAFDVAPAREPADTNQDNRRIEMGPSLRWDDGGFVIPPASDRRAATRHHGEGGDPASSHDPSAHPQPTAQLDFVIPAQAGIHFALAVAVARCADAIDRSRQSQDQDGSPLALGRRRLRHPPTSNRKATRHPGERRDPATFAKAQRCPAVVRRPTPWAEHYRVVSPMQAGMRAHPQRTRQRAIPSELTPSRGSSPATARTIHGSRACRHPCRRSGSTRRRYR